MAKIEVDYSYLEKAAKAVDEYVDNHRNKMKNMTDSLIGLNTTWQGDDYQQVLNEWNEINAGDSTSEIMIGDLKDYAVFLRYSATRYKKAQTTAVNKAYNLPRW